MRKIPCKEWLLAAICCLPGWIFSQSWGQLERFGNELPESAQLLLAAGADTLLAGGTFRGTLPLGDTMLTSAGEQDVFLFRMINGIPEKVLFSGGGALGDQLTEAATDAAGNLYLTGTFWRSARFNGHTLSTDKNPNAIFLARTDPAGQISWITTIEGTGLKDAADLSLASEDRLGLLGYFSDTLFVADTFLVAGAATDVFFTEWNADGELEAAFAFGGAGNNRGVVALPVSDDDWVIGGTYDDEFRIGDTSITAATNDRDGFLLRLHLSADRQTATARWLRRLGGIHEDDLVAGAYSRDSTIWLTGFFVGRLEVSKAIVLESQDGHADAFLVRFSAAGEPLSGTVFTGDLLQQPSDLVVGDWGAAVSGYFQEEIRVDGQRWEARNFFDGFVARFDPQGRLNNLLPLSSDDWVIPERIVVGDRVFHVWGSFSGTLQLDDRQVQAPEGFDLFLARWDSNPTHTTLPSRRTAQPVVFPNPATTHLYWTSKTLPDAWRLFDANGRLLLVANGDREPAIDVSRLPAGIYFLQVFSKAGVRTERVVIR